MPVLLGTLSGYAYSTILAGIGAVLLVAVLYFALITFPVPKHAQGFPLAEGMRLVRDRGLMLIALTLLLQSSMEGVVNNWTTTFLQQAHGIEAHDALFALSAFVGGLTAARLVLGWVLRAVASERVLLTGIALAGVGIAVVAASTGPELASAGLAVVGIGLAAAFPLLLGYVADLYPAISGTAFSIVLAIALFGNMAINYLVGVLIAWHGAEHLPLWLGVCLALEFAVAVAALRAYKARVQEAGAPG
jgi:fucose permease